MLQILNAGRAVDAAEGPGELLLGCHERIRRFTALAARLASAEKASAASVAETAGRVHRYYAVALPLHQADEELSIAPRLERVAPPEVLEALAKMKREHIELDEVLSWLLPFWELLAREPGRRSELAPGMSLLVGRVQALWRRHLAAEEETIFPALEKLEAGELAQVTTEMRARRLPAATTAAR